MRKRPAVLPAFYLSNFAANRFTAHSQNKSGGTGDIREHHRSVFVVGAGNANT
jgi:hypothetical protein